MRQIVLDTETTGIHIEEGHRIIEIGCIELVNRKITQRYYQQYLNPHREIEAGALAVHGITNEFLKDKPKFSVIAETFINFIRGAELIIHNAPFDVGFINNELVLTQQGWQSLTDYCQIVDTLLIARQLHVGQRNSLDALCKRYAIDNSKRDLHGALLDAHLLAQVYLAMTGGQGSFFDGLTENQSVANKTMAVSRSLATRQYRLPVLKANAKELASHEHHLQTMKKQGKCLWLLEDHKIEDSTKLS